MATIFISHSRRDANLVAQVRQILINIGHVPRIEEFIPPEERKPIPHDEIQEKLSLSDAVFLFLTDSILTTEYTKNWVMFEVGLARQALKRVFVFERQGTAIPYPVPYLTDYMIFDPQSINDLLGIQKVAKSLAGKIPKGWIGAGAGAIIGAIFGPLGMGIGAVAGGLVGHGADVQDEPKIPVVQCPHENCHVTFRYYSPNILSFACPACRQLITLARWTQ